MQYWYALKIFFNKVFDWETLLQAKGLETYLAVEKVPLKGPDYLSAKKKLAESPNYADPRLVVEGLQISRRKPLVSSLLFVKASREEVLCVQELLNERDGIGRVRGFIYRNAEKNGFATIPDKEMESFRLVVEAGAGGLELFGDEDFSRFEKGSKVRVKEGPLKGAEGYIKRIRKDRRLLVSVHGVIAVATSFIPFENLEIIRE